MENTLPTKTESVPGSQADTSEDSIKSPDSGSMPLGASRNSSENTTATTLPASRKTSKNVDWKELQSRIGLVAGALADFQTAGGLVAHKQISYEREGEGKTYQAIKIVLVVDSGNLVAVDTPDGIDFQIDFQEGTQDAPLSKITAP